MMIYHIAEKTDWARALSSREYKSASLGKRGFIHCSTRDQLVRVANNVFKGKNDLLLLCIEEEKLNVPVRYENLEGGNELFPHVYGPFPLEAISEVLPFEPKPDGYFELPLL